jgi:hypothetical protein
MVSYKKSKKAVEIGLNVIILLVIGLTVLGLVIGFVTNLLKKGSAGIDSQMTAAEQAQMDSVGKMPGYFAIGPESVTVSPNEKKRIFAKVVNRNDEEIKLAQGQGAATLEGTEFWGGTSAVGDQVLNIKLESTKENSGCTIAVSSGSKTIAPGETAVLPISITPAGACSKETIYFIATFYPTGVTGDVKKEVTLTLDIQ